jgi:glycosyltransferase involved in cell wall biosynthesis
VTDASVGIVVIGRNEGDRLVRCLQSLPQSARVVYVDSGSTDGSLERARALGFEALPLSSDAPFSAARARNAGVAFFREQGAILDFIQMVDGDCELSPAWINQGVEILRTEPGLAVVFGRRREKEPNASLYNALCDDEWNVPIGLADSCGGDALFRACALDEARGYDERLIAGEEPDLCLRLRQRSWIVRRIDAEMTLHDAAMTEFRQWWLRARRAGFAYAEHIFVHRRHANQSWIRSLFSIIFWAALLPTMLVGTIIVGLLTGKFGLVLVGLSLAIFYPVQWVRIARRKRSQGASLSFSRGYASLMLAGKFAQLGGAARAGLRYVTNSPIRLIEYKGQ